MWQEKPDKTFDRPDFIVAVTSGLRSLDSVVTSFNYFRRCDYRVIFLSLESSTMTVKKVYRKPGELELVDSVLYRSSYAIKN